MHRGCGLVALLPITMQGGGGITTLRAQNPQPEKHLLLLFLGMPLNGTQIDADLSEAL